MSILNPYAQYLDDRPLGTILSSTPEEVRSLLSAMNPDNLSTSPNPDKWSAREIICHLADCELVFGFRLRQTLAEDAPIIQPFDQDKWAAAYDGIPIAQALEVFSALRGWNVQFINASLPQAATRPVTHPDRGTMTFQTLVETIAGHDLNHLIQLRKMAEA